MLRDSGRVIERPLCDARPMPLVEPVTSAVLPFRIPMLFTVFWLRVAIR